jgi:hypothetical protein
MVDRVKRTDAERMQDYRERRRAAGLVKVCFWVRESDLPASRKVMATLVARGEAALEAADRAAARKARAERVASWGPRRIGQPARALNETEAGEQS